MSLNPNAWGGSYESDSLRVGDIITLRQSKPYDGWLTTEEFLGDCYVKRSLTKVEDSLWEVQVQQQYLCSQEYDYMFSESMQRAFSPEETQLLNALLEAAENEEYLNKKLMAMKIGKHVVFGDVVQLCHKKSRKLLTVSSSVLAKTERENMKVQVLPLGDVNSWLELIPRYKYDHEGQIITNGAEFHLRVRERSSEFIHGAKKAMTNDDSIREVNSSLETAAWTLGIYQHAAAKNVKDMDIMCGHLISLQDIELSSYITVSEDNSNSPPHTPFSSAGTASRVSSSAVVASPPTRLSFVSTDCNIGTELLWMIEQKKFCDGGRVERYMALSLRHFNSGLFMKIDNGLVVAVPDRADASYFEFVMSQNIEDSTGLQEGCSIQLSFNGHWLSMVRSGSERKCIPTKDKSQAIQLAVSAKAIRLFDSDLYMCNECRLRMKSFERMISTNQLKGNGNSEYIIRALFSVLEQLDEFLNPDDATVVRAFERMGISVPFETAKQELIVIRQTILREQGGLDAIIALLAVCNEDRIPDDVAFDRKHLSILASVGAIDLSRIKPKKRNVQAADEAQPIKQNKTGKSKFLGAARSIAAVHRLAKPDASLKTKDSESEDGKGTDAGWLKPVHSVDPSDPSSDDDSSSNPTSAMKKVTRRLVHGLRMKGRPKAIDPMTELEKAGKRSTEPRPPPSPVVAPATVPASRFLFRHLKTSMHMSVNSLMSAESVDRDEEDGADEIHDKAQADQLQALDKRHASLDAYLAHFCLKVLLSALLKSRPNQMHLADSIHVILGQVMENPVAVFCIQTMLTGNLPMLQNKIKDKEIQLFLNLVRDNSMNATFLQLLINTCSCPMGIDATQRVISLSLFSSDVGEKGGNLLNEFTTTNNTHEVLLRRARGDRDSISLAQNKETKKPMIISLVEDGRATMKSVWSVSKLYFPTSADDTKTVLGYEVVVRGVPRLYLQWKSQDADFTMEELFRYSVRVPIETICALITQRNEATQTNAGSRHRHESTSAMANGGEKQSGGRRSSVGNMAVSMSKAARKQSTAAGSRAVRRGAKGGNEGAKDLRQQGAADYFVAQLYLAAALCLDRNYVAIRILEPHYSLENLLAVLQTKQVVSEIKAPVCSLLHSLYIDREPQVAINFPRLIRTSVSLVGGDENVFNPAPFKFAVIQHIISDYIRSELNVAHCDELSCEMMNLLASLMTFGFYSCIHQMADVINPLLQTLEDHRVSNVQMSSGEDGDAWEAAVLSNVGGSSPSGRTLNGGGGVFLKASAKQRMPSMKQRLPSQKNAPSRRYQEHMAADDGDDDSGDESLWGRAQEGVSSMISSVRAALFSPKLPPRHGSNMSMRSRRTSMNSAVGQATESGVDRGSVNRGSGIPDDLSEHTSGSGREGKRNSLTLLSGQGPPPGYKGPMMQGYSQQPEATSGQQGGGFYAETVILAVMQSNKALFVVLALVVATTVLSILTITDSITFSAAGLKAYSIFDLFVSAVFMADLAIRYTCVTRIQGRVFAFFEDIFNIVDVCIVLMDIVLLSIGGFGSSSFSAGLKAIRFARVLRVMRAARILTHMAKKTVYSQEEWVSPRRYSHIQPLEAKTYTGILRVISLTKQRIQDRQLGQVLKAFVSWYEDEQSGIVRDPVAAFKASIVANSGVSLIPQKKFDDILLDVVMYSDERLVEEALHTMMVHKSQDRLLLEATSKIQIISKPEVEEKYKILLERLRFLRNTAETFEIWCSLSTEEDKKVAVNMISSLSQILDFLKLASSAKTIECDDTMLPDLEIQQLLVNTDALSTFMMIQEALTAEGDVPAPVVLDIVRKCNELICCFVLMNDGNQKLVFKHLDWFMDKIDLGVNSAQVIRAVLWSNRVLIKEFPRSFISSCAQRIRSRGQIPDYLDVLVGLTHVADTGDSGVMSIRNEIAKAVTNVERSGIFSNWCAAPGSEYYRQRKEAMAPFLVADPAPDRELPPALLYHINYIYLLSGCRLGPRLQAIYQVDDIVAAIVDPDTIYNVRAALGSLLKQTTDQYAENFDISESMWRFIEFSLENIFKFKTETMSLSPKLVSPGHRFQVAQWMQFSLEIIANFFDCFGMDSFTQAIAYDSEVYFIQTKRTVSDVQRIINELTLALEDLRWNKYLGAKLRERVDSAAVAVTRHVSEAVANALEAMQPNAAPGPVGSVKGTPAMTRRNNVQRGASAGIQQAFYRQKFSEYVLAINQSYTDAELYASAIELLEQVPSQYDHVHVGSDVRLEPLILKLMMHIKSQLKTSVISRTMERKASETTLWLLKTLRLMLEKNMECTVKDICEPTFHLGAASAKVIYLQDTMNSSGVTELCMDLIAVGIDQAICVQAAELLVCILARSGGNTDSQLTINSYLSLTDSSLFFEEIKELVEQQVIWCQRDAESRTAFDPDEPTTLPDQIVVLKLIQLMCEGNSQPNKNILRDQDGNTRFVNILGSIVEYIKMLSRAESPGCTKAAVRLTNTIVFLIQGPCVGNQEYFVLHSDLLAALNRLLRSARPASESSLEFEWDDDLELLKENIIDTLRACIEAQSRGSAVMERVESVTEVNVLNVLILAVEDLDDNRHELTSLQSKYLAFLPTLNEDQEFPAHIMKKIQEAVASIEVIWEGSIHHIFFDVPQITQGISESRKKKLMDEIESANQDEKLKDFMKRARGVYIEVVHTEWLHRVGLLSILQWESRIMWMMFGNALAINAFIIATYTVDPQADEIVSLTEREDLVIHTLGIAQALMCCLTLFLTITVKLPVRYKTALVENNTRFEALVFALTEPLLLWYSIHLLIVMVSFYFLYHLMLSLLLLDFIVLDPTNKTILYAVYIPASLLIKNILVTLILLQMGACVVFLWFRDQYIHFDVMSMWDSFRIAVAYGLRAVDGLGQIMNEELDNRIFFDFVMFFVVVLVLRNIFFGIIIDTFGELRDTKAEKEADAANRCFICGVDRFEYDKRAPHGSINFTVHRESDHNMWNYLYFAMKIWRQPQDQDSGIEV
jgi:hypothetical protein